LVAYQSRLLLTVAKMTHISTESGRESLVLIMRLKYMMNFVAIMPELRVVNMIQIEKNNKYCCRMPRTGGARDRREDTFRVHTEETFKTIPAS
jgi:hypothetical protein